MSGDAECVTRFFRALFAMVVKPISDFRLLISGLCVLLFALCVAEAQQPNRFNGLDTRRQVEIPTPPGALIEAFRQRLRDRGHIEEKNRRNEKENPRDRSPDLPLSSNSHAAQQ
jgi:hypothetical protein